jgi:hypothetical protein
MRESGRRRTRALRHSHLAFRPFDEDLELRERLDVVRVPLTNPSLVVLHEPPVQGHLGTREGLGVGGGGLGLVPTSRCPDSRLDPPRG